MNLLEKPSVPSQVKSHQYQVPLYEGPGAKRRSEALICGHRGADRSLSTICVDRDSSESEV